MKYIFTLRLKFPPYATKEQIEHFEALRVIFQKLFGQFGVEIISMDMRPEV